MAGLDDAQIKWLDAVTIKMPTDPNAQVDSVATQKAVDKLLAGFKADAEKQVLREEKLNAINKKIAEMRDELKAAQSFQVAWEVEETTRFWQRTPKESTMNWSEANAPEDKRKGGKKSKVDDKERMIRDIEVDTKHDLRGKYYVKGDEVDKTEGQTVDWEQAGPQVRKLLTLHAKLVDMQTEMEKAEDPSGKPLFTARDIERELWSPLVKADTIPSNAVADKYSQEAQVFSGAAEVYEERLKEYSKKASKHEKLQRALRIGGDFVLMAGTVASASIRAANFDGASMSTAEKRELEGLKAQDKLTPFTDGSPQKLRMDELSEMSAVARDATLQQGLTSTAAAFIQGTFDITSKSLNKESETKAWQIAEATFNTILGAAIGSVGGYGSSVLADRNATENDKSRATDLTRTVQSLITYGLAGSKMIFRLKEALDAPEDGRDKFIKAIVVALGDAIGSSFAAFDTSKITDSNGTVVQQSTEGQWGKIGAYISTAIISAANFAEIARMLQMAHKDGLKIEPGAIITAFGLNIIAPAMVGQYDVVSDKVRPDIGTSGSGGNFVETEKERELRDKGDVKALQEMAKSMPNLNQLMSAFKTLPSEEDLANKVAAEANKRNEAKTKAELKALSEEITKDPKKKQALIDSIIDENEERKAEINKLIALASSPTALVDPTAKNSEAKASMDRLIAESEATKAKWAALDAITAGGVGLLVSFLPAAGLAAALRQLVSDVAWLIKKSKELNLWQKNMALTFGNDSVYGPAINSRLASAQIQVSQKAINVVFSTIGVTAESLRLGDITGIATGISIGNTMARALTDFGYKMQKEAEIDKGWKLYKKARSSEGAGDRKLARKAMRWNSTLSKCVIAYGIVKDSDPIAAEVARNCGLSPEVLSDENDVCQRVVTYFLSVYSDDPVVLRRIPVIKDWHPAIPKLELENWLKFKAAALTKAAPPLADDSSRTTRIDTAFSDIDALWKGKGYVVKRDELTSAVEKAMGEAVQRLLEAARSDDDDEEEEEDEDELLKDPAVIEARKALNDFLQGAAKSVELAIDALDAYVPLNGPVPEGVEATWTEGSTHRDMRLVVESLASQAMVLRSEIDYDIKAAA